nr:MAG TPA: hypothetical protein [Caudoviricetes sp.]
MEKVTFISYYTIIFPNFSIFYIIFFQSITHLMTK